MAAKHKRCVEAERYYQNAMDVAQSGGEGHVQWWDTLLELADFLRAQQKYTQAEPLLIRGWDCMEKKENPCMEQRFSLAFRLASVFHSQAKYDQAEPFYYHALKDLQQFAGADHPQTILLLNQLGSLFFDQRRYDRAEQVYLRTLSWMENNKAKSPIKQSEVLDRLAEIMTVTDRKAESEKFRKASKAARTNSARQRNLQKSGIAT